VSSALADLKLIPSDVQDKSVQRLLPATASMGTTAGSRTKQTSKRTVSTVASLVDTTLRYVRL